VLVGYDGLCPLNFNGFECVTPVDSEMKQVSQNAVNYNCSAGMVPAVMSAFGGPALWARKEAARAVRAQAVAHVSTVVQGMPFIIIHTAAFLTVML